MKYNKLFFLFLALASFQFSNKATALPHCSKEHCGGISNIVNEWCIKNGMSGKLMLTMEPALGYCECMCSCVASGTIIETTKGPIKVEHVLSGDLTILDDVQSEVTTLLRSEASNADANDIEFELTSIIVSPNHVFVTEGEKTILAQNLKSGDSVLNTLGKPVQVIKNTSIKYTGDLHNLVINPKSKNPEDHIFITNDLRSGDFSMQITRDRIERDIHLRLDKLDLGTD